MTDYLEIVTARVVTADGAPVRGATVRLYDKDLIADDHLGTAETNADGSVRIKFRWSDYRDSGFEGRPDIFLKITTPSGGETRTKVFEELEGVLAEDDSEEVMDLGDIVVTS